MIHASSIFNYKKIRVKGLKEMSLAEGVLTPTLKDLFGAKFPTMTHRLRPLMIYPKTD